MIRTPLYLAAVAVDALDVDVVATRPPFVRTEDFVSGCVLDSRGRHWMVKVPRNAGAATILEAEAALAPALLTQLRAGNLPFDIMRPAGSADVEGAGRAVVYPEPFGKAAPLEELTEAQAREFGRALAAIHLLPPDTIEEAGLPSYTVKELRERTAAEVSNGAATGDVPAILRRRWERLLADDALWQFTPVVVHGDVAGENFLWSHGTIATVLGFGEAHVGDPARDLAPLLYLEPAAWDAIVASYENTRSIDLSEGDFRRILFASELSVLRWLMHGVTTGNDAIRNDGIQMLGDLADHVREDETTPITPVVPVDTPEMPVGSPIKESSATPVSILDDAEVSGPAVVPVVDGEVVDPNASSAPDAAPHPAGPDRVDKDTAGTNTGGTDGDVRGEAPDFLSGR
ncbi:phosphotransferase [Neoactinobaculum massilliense]|uniref:phosphotransferase n=1 Tax=Neoactinobaculum massilliense TaxID=2364794 RepID=UPI000F51B7BF|nr:phosphotransferase [Neoactinobaculum massilliense]